MKRIFWRSCWVRPRLGAELYKAESQFRQLANQQRNAGRESLDK
jgi:hypothetical protein